MNDIPKFENNRTKLNIWLPLLFSITAIAGMLLGFKLKSAAPDAVKEAGITTLSGKGSIGKLEEMLRYIETRYVDEVDRDKLIDVAIESILEELDPHSNYITKDQMRIANESLNGHFNGVGLKIYMLNDTVLITDVTPEGPAGTAGILAGDKLISVDDSLVAGVDLSANDIVNLLRGEKGDPVKMGVKRRAEENTLEFEVIRDKIPNLSVDAFYQVDPKTGYIKVSRFSSSTYEEFMKALEEMYSDGITDLVIDLRGNPGGYLSAATKIADQLFDKPRQLIVYTEGRKQRRNEYKSSGRNFFELNKIAVLVDEGSASASEILAGAIQDWDRGPIIGRRTFGKGLVQEPYNLSDGSGLRLTIARYYTPSGRSIQKPYDPNDSDDYSHETADRFLTGELINKDSIKIMDSTEYLTATGRVVYGGGGIIPDYFVPIEDIVNNSYYRQSSMYIPEFVYEYLEYNENSIGGFESIDEFQRKFKVLDKMYRAFQNLIEEKGISASIEEKKEAREKLEQTIKAHFAQYYFKEKGFYATLNQDDPIYKKAIEVLN